MQALSSLVVRAGAGVLDPQLVPWDELAIDLASRSQELGASVGRNGARVPLNAEARIVRTLRDIDRIPRPTIR
jgi:hypothetical protein